jgi:hypothetical protein
MMPAMSVYQALLNRTVVLLSVISVHLENSKVCMASNQSQTVSHVTQTQTAQLGQSMATPAYATLALVARSVARPS